MLPFPALPFQSFVGLLRTLPRRGALRALVRWKPFSVTSFEMVRRLRRERPVFHTVIDGGANVGQFARAVAEAYPEAAVYSFEPLPDVAATFRRHLADRPRVRVFEMALGAAGGEATFHQTPYSLQSSILAPTAVASTQITVPVARLDDALAGETLRRPLLVKLDLQGYELEALRGAPRTLEVADAVLLEVAFRPAYEGEPLFHDVHAFLEAAGFRFLRPLDVLAERGEIVQMDVLFVRADA